MKTHIINAIESSVILNELYQVIGYEPLLALVSKRGGQGVYIPQRFAGEEHPLVKLIGSTAAEALSWRYAGETINLPTNMLIKNAKRDHLIAKMRTKGISVPKMAVRFQLSQRRVRVILRDQGNSCKANPLPRPTAHNRNNRRPQSRKKNSGQLELFNKI